MKKATRITLLFTVVLVMTSCNPETGENDLWESFDPISTSSQISEYDMPSSSDMNSSNMEQKTHIPTDKDFEITSPQYKNILWLNDDSFAVCLSSKMDSTLKRIMIYNATNSQVIGSFDFKQDELYGSADMDIYSGALIVHLGNLEVKISLSDMSVTHTESQDYVKGTKFAGSGWAAIPLDN